jgi:hypothetical protein
VHTITRIAFLAFLPLTLLVLNGIMLPTLSAQQPRPELYTVEEFAVGNGPDNFTSDGSNIWVSNSSDNTLTKLRASDGTSLGTFPVGNHPQRLAFDGSNDLVGQHL